MEPLGFPTLGQLLQYLHGLGFAIGPADPGYILAEHPKEDCWFVFRERSPENPARESEVKDVRFMLTARGLVSERDFALFWASCVLPISPPAA